VPGKAINYADLNLSRAADVAVLYHRIEGAANLVCDLYASRDLARNLRFRHCTAEAIDRAVADVHAPLLTQRHAALTGRQTVPPQAMRLNP
jgi:UrcA family protein